MKGDLKNKSIRGGISTILATALSYFLRTISIVIMARLLLPEHFGLIGMVTALLAFTERFKDLGLSLATVQRREITHEQVSVLFWINVGIGTLIMVMAAALSPVIAWFYNDPRLIWISVVLATSFFFGGLTIQHEALMRRQMMFGRLGWIQVQATMLSVVVGIALAWMGFGYWSLVWKEVLRTAYLAASTWIACGWLPGRPVRRSGARSMIRFGRDITGFDLINVTSRSLDQILIGKVWGAVSLGFYRQAFQLMALPVTLFQFPVQYVAEPTLSAVQYDDEKYRSYFKKIVALVSFISMPIAVYLWVYSKQVIIVLLGEKWIQAAPIFKVLAVAAFIQPIASMGGIVMVTRGETGRYFRLGIMTAICLISSFSIGIFWGTMGVAIAYSLVTYLIFVPLLWYSFHNSPITVSLLMREIAGSLAASLLMGGVLLFLEAHISYMSNTMVVAISLITGILVYFGLWLLFPNGRQKITEIISYPLSAYKLRTSGAGS